MMSFTNSSAMHSVAAPPSVGISNFPSSQAPFVTLPSPAIAASMTALYVSVFMHVEDISPKTSRVPSLQRLRHRFFGTSSKNASLAASEGSSQVHLLWAPSFLLAPSIHLHSPESNTDGSSSGQEVQSSDPIRLNKLPCCLQLLHVKWHFCVHLLP